MFPIEISAAEARELLANDPTAVLIDCREEEEYAVSRIDGSRLIPMSQFMDRLSELEPVRGNRLVVHCQHGFRSLRVVNALRARGFDHAQSMAGGIEVWE
jgi:rhodanese-related sulfurtransferase